MVIGDISNLYARDNIEKLFYVFKNMNQEKDVINSNALLRPIKWSQLRALSL